MSALECCAALYKAFSGRQEEGHKNVMRSEIERAKKLALCLCDTSSPIAGVFSLCGRLTPITKFSFAMNSWTNCEE